MQRQAAQGGERWDRDAGRAVSGGVELADEVLEDGRCRQERLEQRVGGQREGPAAGQRAGESSRATAARYGRLAERVACRSRGEPRRQGQSPARGRIPPSNARRQPTRQRPGGEAPQQRRNRCSESPGFRVATYPHDFLKPRKDAHRSRSASFRVDAPEVRWDILAMIRFLCVGSLCVVVFLTEAVLKAQSVLITAPTTIGPTDTTVTATGGGPAVPLASAQIVVNGATLTINGRHRLTSLVIENGSIVTHDINFSHDYSGVGSDVVAGFALSVSGDVVVNVGCAIDVSTRGHLMGQGPGAGSGGPCGLAGSRSGSGGGYGGSGGASNSVCFSGGDTYGSYEHPTGFGSGGGAGFGSGGRGGGSVKILSLGTVTIDGEVKAMGQYAVGSAPGGGGGAGGSIWIDAATLALSGAVDASGGGSTTSSLASPGSGGGGRVRLAAVSLQSPGVVRACGGPSNGTGGAGTILTVANSISTLRIDACGLVGGSSGTRGTGGTTDFDEPIRVDHMLVTGRAKVSAKRLKRLIIYVRHDLTVDLGASIWVSGRGYRQNQGFAAANGAGVCGQGGLAGSISCTGGAHGNSGGASYRIPFQGVPYGRLEFPITFGSGGGGSGVNDNGYGGAGGGAVSISVAGTFRLDGTVDASGESSFRRAGGAGGSILVSSRHFATGGTGTLECRGGDGYYSTVQNGGGGAGGRIGQHASQVTGSIPHNVSGGARHFNNGTSHTSANAFGVVFPRGAGCAGTAGVPQLEVTPPNDAGGTMEFVLTEVDSGVINAVLLLGLNPGVLDLSPLQMTGCSLYHDIILSVPFSVARGTGTSQLSHPSLGGLTLYSSVVFVDIGANPAGLVLTEAAEILF